MKIEIEITKYKIAHYFVNMVDGIWLMCYILFIYGFIGLIFSIFLPYPFGIRGSPDNMGFISSVKMVALAGLFAIAIILIIIILIVILSKIADIYAHIKNLANMHRKEKLK